MTTPRERVEPLIGHKVRITFRRGRPITTVLHGCGDGGLTILSGIGGMIRYNYSDIDDVKDLEDAATAEDDYPVVPFQPDPRLVQVQPAESWWVTFPGAITIIGITTALFIAFILIVGTHGGDCK